MTNKVQSIPEGFQTLTPYLVVAYADKELEFVQSAFGATPMHISRRPDGVIMHASLKVGSSMLMMGQASEPWKPLSAAIYMYVEDVDATYKAAIEAGGKSMSEPRDQFYGDRTAGVESPNGIWWWIGTHIEDVPDDELQRRAIANMSSK
jgi:uncharacterized glyoxalase superfamily protein PhnB